MQDVRKQRSKSIDELRGKDYFQRDKFRYDLKEINFLDFFEFCSNASNDNDDFQNVYGRKYFKNSYKMSLVAVRPFRENRKYVEYTVNYYEDPFKFATDNLFTMQHGFKVNRNVYFYGAIRATLQKLFESGVLKPFLTEYIKEYSSLLNLTIHKKQEEYNVLTWNQLYPGFYLWLAACAVCFIVFIGEILVFKIKTRFFEPKNPKSIIFSKQSQKLFG